MTNTQEIGKPPQSRIEKHDTDEHKDTQNQVYYVEMSW